MTQIKIFKDGIINAYENEVSGAENQANDWIKNSNVKIISIQATSEMCSYKWVPYHTRGESDHEKRRALFTTITIIYEEII